MLHSDMPEQFEEKEIVFLKAATGVTGDNIQYLRRLLRLAFRKW